MFETVISKQAQGVLASIEKLSCLKQFYLGGGTGLALQLGHRLSEDFDFFSQKQFIPQKLVQILGRQETLKVDSQSAGTLHASLHGTRLTFLYYPYCLLFPLRRWNNIALADIRDIACMKLTAVADRGTKKDFIDLYAIMQTGITLEKLLQLFEKKFSGVEYNLQHYVKSLVYFADAESDPMPLMLKEITWKQVKKFFENLGKQNISKICHKKN